jgi:hypothetical protein
MSWILGPETRVTDEALWRLPEDMRLPNPKGGVMGFKIEADSEFIRIDGFTVAPGEADNLKAAVSFAGGMREFPGLPPFIPFEQFKVSFFEDGTLTLERLDGSGSKINFDFDTVDALVIAINTAAEISIDRKRLDPSPRAVGSLDMFNSGDVIEGSY